jgi:hypothetical protein
VRLTNDRVHRSLVAFGRGRLIISSEIFEIIYDGPDLSEHKIDVRILAPALLGVGRLIREANTIVNHDKSTVQVLVDSEFKPGSFGVVFDVVQNGIDTAKSLLGSDDIKTAKDILEWLQILGVISGAGVLGFLKWRDGRKVESAQTLADSSGGGSVQVKVEGSNNTTIIIPKEVFALSSDPKITKAVKEVIAPLNHPGIDSLSTKANGETQEILRVSKADISAIEKSCEIIEKDETILSQSTIQAHLRPYDAEFNEQAKTWGFWYGDKHVSVDITETSIAKEAIERRQVSMDDLYKVDLEITERRTPSGAVRVDYKALKVHERMTGPSQGNLL